MKTLLAYGCLTAMLITIAACNQNTLTPDSGDGAARSSATDSSRRPKADSAHRGGPHSGGPHSGKPGSLTTVDAAALPAAVTGYITANYAGATIKKAQKDKDGDFVVLITQTNTATLLRFNADGTFDKAVTGKGPRGRGDSARADSARGPRPKHSPADSVRNGPKSSYAPIDVAALPAAVTSYITATYAGATVKHAVKNTTTGEFLVSITTADKKRIGLLFAADGTFKKATSGR